MPAGWPRRPSAARLAAVLGAAGVLAGCGSEAPVDTTASDVAANLKTVSGLPQDGITLGSDSAPATLTVFDSLDSFNRGFFLSDLPALVRDYVRPGDLKIEVRTLTGFDSGQSLDAGAADAARLAQAAGEQDHLWDFYGALSARYIGTIDSGVLSAALGDVPGIDAAQAQSDARGSAARSAVEEANRLASKEGVTALPYYSLTRGADGTPVPLDGACQGCLTRSLNRALGSPEPTPTVSAGDIDDAGTLGGVVGKATPVPTRTPTVTPLATVTATP